MEQELSEAVSQGSLEECERLLSSGAEINRPDSHGWTPLCLALSCRHSRLARFLLLSGADVNMPNPYGVGALTLAATLDDDSMLSLIHERMTLESRIQQNESALMMACLKGRYSSARWLLTNTSAKVNAISPLTGVSALHLAVIGGHKKVVELLLVFGANPLIKTALGQTSIDLLEKQNKPDLELLRLLSRIKGSSHFQKKREKDSVDPLFTTNNILLDIGGDVVLKNSPNRPVFDKNIDPGIQALLTPTMRSVFLESPLSKSTPNEVFKAAAGNCIQLPKSNCKNPECVQKQQQKSRCSLKKDYQDKYLTSAKTRMVIEEGADVFSPILKSSETETKSSFFNNFILTPLKNSIHKSRKRGRDHLEQERSLVPESPISRKVRKLSYNMTDSPLFEDQNEDFNVDFNNAFMTSPQLNNLSPAMMTNKPENQSNNFKLGLNTLKSRRIRHQKLTFNQTRESKHLVSLLSPKYFEKHNPIKERKKRNWFNKIKWLKTLPKIKTRSRSMDDSGGYFNFDELKDDGIDLQKLLFNHGLEEFESIFMEQELDFSTFITLERSDLTSLGIEDQETQNKILQIVENLKHSKL